jgi:hypothetical protein
MASAKFRYVGEHAQQDMNLAPGDFVHLNAKQQEQPHVVDMLATGVLIPTGEASERAVDKAEREAAKSEKEATT